MSTGDRSFDENLDLLIKLLRKLKDKTDTDDIPGMPKMFFANFDFVINNYEMMKDHISSQLLNQFGEPIKQMVADMVEQLKEELGDDLDMIIEETEEPIEEKPVLPQGSDNLAEAINKIDSMLSKTGLTEDEINKLHDERAELKSRQEK